MMKSGISKVSRIGFSISLFGLLSTAAFSSVVSDFSLKRMEDFSRLEEPKSWYQVKDLKANVSTPFYLAFKSGSGEFPGGPTFVAPRVAHEARIFSKSGLVVVGILGDGTIPDPRSQGFLHLTNHVFEFTVCRNLLPAGFLDGPDAPVKYAQESRSDSYSEGGFKYMSIDSISGSSIIVKNYENLYEKIDTGVSIESAFFAITEGAQGKSKNLIINLANGRQMVYFVAYNRTLRLFQAVISNSGNVLNAECSRTYADR